MGGVGDGYVGNVEIKLDPIYMHSKCFNWYKD